MHLKIRQAKAKDVARLCELLNEIIVIGGSTAIETPLSTQDFINYFLAGANKICCFVAEDGRGVLWGFQALGKHNELADSCADIATFAHHKSTGLGIGTALFAKTRQYAIDAGYKEINATIRKDNLSGLAYYTKMGFVDHSVAEAIALRDGTPVDRASKRFTLI